MHTLEILSIFFVFGLIFGSFASAISYRLVYEKSCFTRSQCVKCFHALGVIDLIPVISYILCGGVCRYCSNKISLRYPIIELITALMFCFIGMYVEDTLIQVLLCMVSVSLMIIIIIDFEYYIIPDIMQFIMAVLGIIYAYFSHYPLIQVLLTPLLCYIIGVILQKGSKFFMRREGLGYGDVKFFAVAGIYLQTPLIANFFLVSGMIGIITAIIWKILSRGEEFPFGPSLAVSLYLCLVFPEVSNMATFIRH